MGKYKFIITTIITIILLSFALLGCDDSKKVEKITIDSLSEVSDEQLIKDVNKYLDELENPVTKERILMYANKIEYIYKHSDAKWKKGVGILINEIPVAGGLILDYGDHDVITVFTERMESASVEDYSILEELNYNNVAGTEKERNYTIKKFKEEFMSTYVADPEPEVYNILMMIGALKCRQVEIILEDTEIRMSLDPDIFDIISFYSYDIFIAPENRARMEKIEQGLAEIYSKLPYDPHADIKFFFECKIPTHLYPYNLEQLYITAESDNLIRDNLADKNLRMKLYNIVNGEWYSLRNEKVTNIQFDPDYDDKIFIYPKINYISCIDKKEYCAAFNYRDYNDKIHDAFFIPVKYYDDNTQEDEVLIMYVDYNLHDDMAEDYLKHLDLKQMVRAEDILIKRKSGSNGYECEFDKEMFLKFMPIQYMLKSELKKSYIVENTTNIILENNIEKNDRSNVYNMFNGSWTSLLSGENFSINADVSNEQSQKGSYIGGIDFVNNDASFTNFIGFNIPGKYYSTKTIFITPVTHNNNGVDEDAIVAYINPNFTQFNDQSPVSERVKYYQIDNIKNAEDVWIKSR